MDKVTQLGKNVQENNDEDIFSTHVENLGLIIKQEEVCFELSEDIAIKEKEGYFHPIEEMSIIEKEDYSEPADVLIKEETYDFELIDQDSLKQKNDIFEQVGHERLLIPEVDKENVASSKLGDGGVMADEEDDFQKDEIEIDYMMWSPNEEEPDPLALYPNSKPVVNRTKKTISNFLPLRTDPQTLWALEVDANKYRFLEAERKTAFHNKNNKAHDLEDMNIKKEKSHPLSTSLLISNTTTISHDKFRSLSPLGVHHQKESFKIEIPSPTTHIEETITPLTKIVRLKNYCLYCKSLVLNFGRHLIKKHKSEIEVQYILSMLPNSKERKDMISILRKKGNFMQNENEESKKETKRVKVIDDRYLPCIYCLGFYVKKQLSKHRSKCLQNPINTRSCLSVVQNLFVKDLHVDEQLRVTVFPRMRADMPSLIAKKDPLICEFGARYLKKGIERKDIVPVTSKWMRILAKLLIEIKKKEPNKSFVQVLKPQYYDLIVQSTKRVVKYDSKRNAVSSYWTRICNLLKYCCEIALTSTLKGDICTGVSLTETDRDLKVMLGLLNLNWKNDISLVDDCCTFENNENVTRTIRRRILEPWTETQKCIVKEYFKEHIFTRQSPRKFECENLQKINPGVFNNKSWLKIKAYIQSVYVKNNKDFLSSVANSTHNIEGSDFERKKRTNSTHNIEGSDFEGEKRTNSTHNIEGSDFEGKKRTNSTHNIEGSDFEGKKRTNSTHNIEGSDFERKKRTNSTHNIEGSDFEGKKRTNSTHNIEGSDFEGKKRTNSTHNIEGSDFEGKKRILVPWTDVQKDIVKDYFKEHILKRRPPKKFECEDLIERYPNVFDNKSWPKIKVYIQNVYKKS